MDSRVTTRPARRNAHAPIPGSKAAAEAGCLCPLADNNHGKAAPYPPDGWWINQDCPLHGVKSNENG